MTHFGRKLTFLDQILFVDGTSGAGKSAINSFIPCFENVEIPAEVRKEVIEDGKKKNYLDIIEIEEGLKENWIKVKDVKIKPNLIKIGIDKSEAEAISLAIEKTSQILLDQKHARNAAILMGMQPKGTIHVLILAIIRGLINYDHFLLCLQDLIDVGFRMSQEVYLEAVMLGKKASQK